MAGDFGTISGGAGNTIQPRTRGATIGGGIANIIQFVPNTVGNIPGTFGATIGGGENNSIIFGANYATISGGFGNSMQLAGLASFPPQAATIGGGGNNSIGAEANYATIGGGAGNGIGSEATYTTIDGGGNNSIAFSADYATIGGGGNNSIASGADYATISGGLGSIVQPNAFYATIPGGRANGAAAYGFAAGYAAQATNQGAFVWSDSVGTTTGSTNDNSVTLRARGGYRLLSSGADIGVYLAPNSGTWTSMSDRNSKEDLAAVDPCAVLDKVAALPVQSWRYKGQDASVRHIGPTAQDFHSAFALGDSELGISSVDADGVALAAIQGLHRLVKEREAEIQALQKRVVALETENEGREARLTRLEKALEAQTGLDPQPSTRGPGLTANAPDRSGAVHSSSPHPQIRTIPVSPGWASR